MKNRMIVCVLLILLGAVAPLLSMPVALAVGPPASADETVATSPALVREIQFMLLTIGIDPGPIDGNSQQLTNRAAHIFQARASLPIGDVTNTGQISAAFVDRLRQEAAQVMFKNAAPAPPMAAAPIPAPSPPPVPQPAPDPFASCPFSAEDFRIGEKNYTTQTFLDEGFDGSTTRAVTSLGKRLEEARQLSERIGGAALLEVQRQARVLAYFQCRLKIEQGATKS